MTRFLSEALLAKEPQFRQLLADNEKKAGYPGHDIRLTNSIRDEVRHKLHLLQLDPFDTSPSELYHALLVRLDEDDHKLVRSLKSKVVSDQNLADALAQTLSDLPISRTCFALKPAVLKSILRQQPPKKTYKILGYRSLESFLKRESIVDIMAAARLVEDESWHDRLRRHYKKLTMADFEDRPIAIVKPTSERFQTIALAHVARSRHNVLIFKELGAVVILPLPEAAPSGAATASLSLAAHGLNQIRAASAMLKLTQVSPAFSKTVISLSEEGGPYLNISVLGQPIRIDQFLNYLIKQPDLSDDLLGPHFQIDKSNWQPVEEVLIRLEDSFSFWLNSAHLAMLSDHRPVSLSLIDNAINLCNKTSFEQRLSDNFRHSLLGELMVKYLHPSELAGGLTGQLATEPALAAK